MSKYKPRFIVTVVIILNVIVNSSSIPVQPSFTNTNSTDDDGDDIDHSIHSYVRVSGIRIENYQQSNEQAFLGYNKKSHSIVKPNEDVRVVIFGIGFANIQALKFSDNRRCNGSKEFSESDFQIMTSTRLVIVTSFPSLENENDVYRLCISERIDGKRQPFIALDDSYTIISTNVPSKTFILPLWLTVPILSVLLVLSGLFSGLNLGLMTLSPHELQLYISSGTAKEKGYAEKILPVRKKGNILLCTLLLGNVVVNSAISLLLDDLIGNGIFALLGSTVGIVIFGEIVPQAICVKRGLEVGAMTVPLTRVIMFLMYPITYSISLILDFFLKEELTQPLGRKKLVEMMKMSRMTCLDEDGNDDFKMALGALEIVDKTAKQAMTKIDDVFMLPSTLKLGPATVNQILEMGYTRIPIYENDRNNVVDLLFIKDLALLDPDDNMDVMKVCSVYKHEVRMVDEDTPLRVLLEEFKKGEYHLAMVHRVVCNDDADPSYELVGLITLEDIIEEIIQAEILDETDAICDNVNRKKRNRKRNHDMTQLVDSTNTKCVISVQMQIVAVQWLTTYHAAFSRNYISSTILDKLIRQHCRKVEIGHLSSLVEIGTVAPKPAVLYTKGEFSDKFILILEGRALVTIGNENMCLEAGAWHVFGSEVLEALLRSVQKEDQLIYNSNMSLNSNRAMKKIGFVPDFSAVVRTDCTFIEISATDWLLAYKSTILTRNPQDTIIRASSRSSLVESIPSNLTSPSRSGKYSKYKNRSCSESETFELLPTNNNHQHIHTAGVEQHKMTPMSVRSTIC